jgi:carbonic anhydrase
VDAGTLRLHGWYFDLEVGDLLGLDAATGEFMSLVRD